MNQFRTINTEYLRPSRTIETVLVSNKCNEKAFFVYNYEGCSFRVFESHLDLIGFFQNEKIKEKFEFATETELDSFLSKVALK